MSQCDSKIDGSATYLMSSCSTSDCMCDSATSFSMDSCSTCDSMYVNCGLTESNDSICQSGGGKESAEDAAEVEKTNHEYCAVPDSAFRTTENVDQLNFTNLKDVEVSDGCCNGLVADVCSAGCNHECGAGCNHEISTGLEVEVKSGVDNVVSKGCSGSGGNNLSDVGGWTVDGAEIGCDYSSVRDDESVISEAFTASSSHENQTKLLDKDVVMSTNSISPIGSNDNRKHSDIDMSSSLQKSDTVNRRVDSLIKPSVAFVSSEKSHEVTVVSAVADGLTLPAADQIPEVSYCQFPPVVHWLADLPQPPQTTCISSPSFSILSPLMQSELPTVQFRPIFYICSDQKPPLEQEDDCAIDMNILQKSEISNVTHHFADRCDSQLSTFSEKQDICRICHCEGEATNKLISPCLCSGSLKFIHLSCLQKWIKSSDKKSCELCNFDYIMTMKTRPFKQWERLDMAMAERRKIVCSVTFHVIAITCVIWSLYVLIDRTSEEVNSGALDWPFWTKLIVVAIGFTGGLVFMYVQVKMYMQLCLRWRQYNKLISVENAPEDTQLRAEAAARIKARSGENGGIVNTVALQEVESF